MVALATRPPPLVQAPPRQEEADRRAMDIIQAQVRAAK
jgi:hypothetical protein